MCDYCEGYKTLPISKTNKEINAEIIIGRSIYGSYHLGVCVGYEQEHVYTSRCFTGLINYCPMCGRKLGDGDA